MAAVHNGHINILRKLIRLGYRMRHMQVELLSPLRVDFYAILRLSSSKYHRVFLRPSARKLS